MAMNGYQGRSLIFVHGSGCNGALWAYQSRYFSKRHRVIALDLPGHGRNTGDSLKSVGEMADFTLSEVERLEVQSPIVAGHSLGGAIALQMAIKAPEKLGALVLVGTGARLRVLPSLLESILTDYSGTLDAIAEYSFSKKTSKPIVDKAMFEMRKVPAQVLYDDLAACERFDVMQQIGEISLPALIIVGQDDFMTPVKYSEYLRAKLPNARLEIIESAGHMVMIEQPERFNTALDAFLAEVPQWFTR